MTALHFSNRNDRLTTVSTIKSRKMSLLLEAEDKEYTVHSGKWANGHQDQPVQAAFKLFNDETNVKNVVKESWILSLARNHDSVDAVEWTTSE